MDKSEKTMPETTGGFLSILEDIDLSIEEVIDISDNPKIC